MSPSLKKWLLFAAKILVVLLLVWFLRASLVKGIGELGRYKWEARPGWLVLSGVLYVAAMLPSALFWHRLLAGAQQPVRLFESVRAFYLSQLGKYVPGKAMVVVLRVGLVARHGVERTVVAVSVFVETLTTMAIGSLWALVLLCVYHTSKVQLIVAAGGMFLATALPTLPSVLKRLLTVLRIHKFNPAAADKLGGARGPLLAGLVGIAAAWVLNGLSLWAVLAGLGERASQPLADLPLAMIVVALSVVAGFLAMIPGGLGVRELVLLHLLEPRYGETTAIVSAIVLRLSWLVSEVAISVILYPARPRSIGGGPPSAAAPADRT